MAKSLILALLLNLVAFGVNARVCNTASDCPPDTPYCCESDNPNSQGVCASSCELNK